MPRLIWQAICYNSTGADLENLVSQAMTALHSDGDGRQAQVENIAMGIESILFQVSLKLASQLMWYHYLFSIFLSYWKINLQETKTKRHSKRQKCDENR